MISTTSKRTQRLLLLGLCMTMLITDVVALCGGKGKGGKYSWNNDPCEDDVDSPPALPFTPPPSAAPTAWPSKFPTESPSVSPSASPSVAPSVSPSTAPTAPTSSPSESPTATMNPTKSPSPTATMNPTKSPSPTATMNPTKSPSPTATPAPTASPEPTFTPRPTVTPSPTTTSVPTKSPSPTMTPSPTTTAAPTMTHAPTKSPSPTDSPSPTTTSPVLSTCTVNEDGFFGEASAEETMVSYGYELEYEQGHNVTEIISDLENSFNEFLLPSLFSSECPPNERKRVLASVRRLATMGISTRRDDEVLDGVTCESKLNDTNECVVCDGSLTIYTDGSTNTGDEDMIRGILKDGMENGDFAQAPIVRVSYVDLEAQPDPASGGSGGDGTTESTPRRRNFVYGVVAGIATLLLLLLAVAWRRKHRENDDTSTMLTDNPDTSAAPATAAV